MTSLFAALVLAQRSDLIESFSFDWIDRQDQYVLSCSLVKGKDKGEILIELSRNGEELWEKTESVTQPLPESSEVVILKASTSSSDRLLAVEVNRVNWKSCYVFLCTARAGFLQGFTYRGSRADSIEFARDSFGTVAFMTTYDRYIGGKGKSVYQNGALLDRWEQVRSFKLTPRGFLNESTRYRLVPKDGGLISEKNFAWRTDWTK